MPKQAELVRDGADVSVTVKCSEIYEAMQLYDELAQALDDGLLKLVIETPRARRMKEDES